MPASISSEAHVKLQQKLSLKRLPIWGWKAPGKINFSWPTQGMLDQMPKDVTLKSLEFKSHNDTECLLSSVKCHLSNGQSSPIFENEQTKHYQPMMINFQAQTPIKAVAAYDGANYVGNI